MSEEIKHDGIWRPALWIDPNKRRVVRYVSTKGGIRRECYVAEDEPGYSPWHGSPEEAAKLAAKLNK